MVFKIEATFHICADGVHTCSKKKRCKIRFGVVCFIEQIGRAHRNRYKYYYFPGVIVLSAVSSLARKNLSDKDLFTLQTVIFILYAQQRYYSSKPILFIYFYPYMFCHIMITILMILCIMQNSSFPLKKLESRDLIKNVYNVKNCRIFGGILWNFKGLYKILFFHISHK